MSTLGQTALTLADWRKRTDPDGNVAKVIEILNDRNPILDDMMWMEGNLPTGHLTTIRSGLPSATWRLLNYGVQPSKSRTVQVTDACGMLSALSVVDAKLLELNGMSEEFRLSEEKPFIEAMNQNFATALFYGNQATDPEQITGLAPRYNSLSAESAQNIINGLGSGADNTSIWLVVWGDNTVHGIYPKGSTAGLKMEDFGKELVNDSATPAGQFPAYRTNFTWDCGLTLRDWRYVVRIANIDVSDLTATGATGAAVINLMIRAIHKIRNMKLGNAVFYCNETIMSILDQQTLNQGGMHLTYGTGPHGEPITSFRGIPVKLVDAIIDAETVVS